MNVATIHPAEAAPTIVAATPRHERPSWPPNSTPLADEHRLKPVAMGKPDLALAKAVLCSVQRVHGPIIIDYDPRRQHRIERLLRLEGLL